MLDDAMDAIEHDNPALGGVLPEDKMRRLVAQWREQQAEAARLDAEIEKNFEMLGFGRDA